MQHTYLVLTPTSCVIYNSILSLLKRTVHSLKLNIVTVPLSSHLELLIRVIIPSALSWHLRLVQKMSWIIILLDWNVLHYFLRQIIITIKIILKIFYNTNNKSHAKFLKIFIVANSLEWETAIVVSEDYPPSQDSKIFYKGDKMVCLWVKRLLIFNFSVIHYVFSFGKDCNVGYTPMRRFSRYLENEGEAWDDK